MQESFVIRKNVFNETMKRIAAMRQIRENSSEKMCDYLFEKGIGAVCRRACRTGNDYVL